MPGWLSSIVDMLGLPSKVGALYTDGKIEPSIAWKMYTTKNENWLLNGWSVDAIIAMTRSGAGIAKDLFKTPLFGVDAGIYATIKHDNLKDIKFGTGLNIQF